MKVTKANISKIYEDTLYNKLDELDEQNLEKSEEYRFIEAEIDRRVAIYIKNKETEDRAKQQTKEKQDALLAEFVELQKTNTKNVVMKAMVAEFGDDFRDDYILDANYTINSLCKAAEYFDVTNTWEHESLEDANAKLNQLIYWRIYDNYFRNGPTQNVINRLTTQMITLKKAA